MIDEIVDGVDVSPTVIAHYVKRLIVRRDRIKQVLDRHSLENWDIGSTMIMISSDPHYVMYLLNRSEGYVGLPRVTEVSGTAMDGNHARVLSWEAGFLDEIELI